MKKAISYQIMNLQLNNFMNFLKKMIRTPKNNKKLAKKAFTMKK